MASMRLGVQLRYRIAVDNTGTPLFLKVTGVLNPVTGVTKPVTVYQFDPANGRIYFSGLDEDNTVTVQYSALKEDGTSFNATDSVLTVALIPEVAEQQILIDNAVNEGDLTSFLDPFTYVSGAARRPPLTWLFWSSSRRGNSDIYFETISPNWVPFPISQ